MYVFCSLFRKTALYWGNVTRLGLERKKVLNEVLNILRELRFPSDFVFEIL
jgi:hypothetical protein